MNSLTDLGWIARGAHPSLHAVRKVLLGIASGFFVHLVDTYFILFFALPSPWEPQPALAGPHAISLLVALLTGISAGPWATVAAACTAATLDSSTSWLSLAVLLACAPAAECLRRGGYPQSATGILFAPYIVAALWLYRGEGPELLSRALATSAAVCLATGVLLLLPRRWMRLKRQKGKGLRHVMFLAVVGSSTATAALWAAMGEAVLHSRHAVLGLGTALLAAHAISYVVSMLLSKALNSIVFDVHDGRSRIRALLPHETSMALGCLTRRLRRLARAERSLQTVLARYRSILKRQQRELGVSRQTLQRQAATLQQQASTMERLRTAGSLAEARWNAIVDQAPEITIIADERGRMTYVSRAAMIAFGYKREKLTGQTVDLLAPPFRMLSHPLSISPDARALTAQSTEAPIQCADGKEREFAIRIGEFSSNGERYYAIQLRHRDSARRGLLALKRAEASVKAARQRRDAFIGSLSHELRTPLHGLIATLDMLREDVLSPDGEKRLQIARASARSLLAIANDVLDLTRLDSGSFSLESRPFDLRFVIGEVVEEWKDRARTRGLLLSCAVHDELPPAFIGDSQRIKQILGNLVSNSLKFTSSGAVRIEARHEDRNCVIDVIDTGPGIPQDKQKSVFEPFVQGDSSTQEKISGAGLGLAICRALSKQMGGRIWLHQTSPNGTTFRVSLPLEISSEALAKEQSLRIFNNPQGRILIVDDHTANQYVVQAMLRTMKCPATIASGGAQALRIAASDSFDLIFMDCRMPGMDGYEATRRLRQMLPTRIPIIAMTANASEQDRKRCLQAGMDDIIAKPFGRRALHDILCKWLAPDRNKRAMTVEEVIATLPIVDARLFDDLWENLRWQIAPMRRICESFMQTVQAVCRNLQKFDLSRLRRELHTLLGSSGMIGARRIERLAGELQMFLRENRMEQAQALHRLLTTSGADFEREFTERIVSGGRR